MADEEVSRIQVKISDEELPGRYSNLVRIAHTREEFILDFMSLVPPQAVVTARIITSPGHLKRTIRAMQENLERYEQAFGAIEEAAEPVPSGEIH